MAWRDFLDLHLIELNAQHTSGALASVLGFVLLEWVAKKVIEPSWPLTVIHWAGNIVVSGCIIYLSIVILLTLGRKLWKMVGGQNAIALSA